MAEDPFSFAVEAAGLSILRLDGVNGTIDITGVAANDSVRVSGERQVRSTSLEDAEARLPEIEVEWEISSDTVIIRTIQPQNTEGRDYIVNYEITLPRDLEVLVGNANGTVNLGAIDGDVLVSQANGEVTGTVTLALNGSFVVEIGNGEIDLDVPANTSAEFSASVGNGTVTVTGLTLQNEQRSSTSVTGTLGAGEGEITLSVANGTIVVMGV